MQCTVDRSSLVSQVLASLRRLISNGEIRPGEKLSEVALAERLDVSRTPVREALGQLIGDGLAIQIPRRGFFVSELSRREIEDLYLIRQLLDPEALRLAGVPDGPHLERLIRDNEVMAHESDPASLIDLDDRWHLDLIAGCPNEVLLGLIRQFMARTRRYELLYMSDRGQASVAVETHRAILNRLAEGELEGACALLRRNMTEAIDPLVEWVESRGDQE